MDFYWFTHMLMTSLSGPQVEEDVELDDDVDVLDEPTKEGAQILVYNDDVNTFDWVVESFIEILGHTSIQSEQLSLMIHYNGKAVVKRGTFKKLRPLKDGLIDRGLSAVIEENG